MIKDLLIAFFAVFMACSFFSGSHNSPEEAVVDVLVKIGLLILLAVTAVAVGCLYTENKMAMKNVILTFLGVFAFACLWKSVSDPLINFVSTRMQGQALIYQYPPYPWPTGVQGVKEAAGFGCKREEVVYPEINIVDKPRVYFFMTQIGDTGSDRNADFPLGANN